MNQGKQPAVAAGTAAAAAPQAAQPTGNELDEQFADKEDV